MPAPPCQGPARCLLRRVSTGGMRASLLLPTTLGGSAGLSRPVRAVSGFCLIPPLGYGPAAPGSSVAF